VAGALALSRIVASLLYDTSEESTKLSLDLSKLRGEEARLRVRSNFEFLQALNYTVVELYGIHEAIPNPASVKAATPSAPIEHHLIKATAILATVATLVKVLLIKWHDLFRG
jgi:hypothetical protein